MMLNTCENQAKRWAAPERGRGARLTNDEEMLPNVSHPMTTHRQTMLQFLTDLDQCRGMVSRCRAYHRTLKVGSITRKEGVAA